MIEVGIVIVKSYIDESGTHRKRHEPKLTVTAIGGHMKHVGTILIIAGIAAFITPRLNVNLPEGLSVPTLPTDILGGILLLAGVFWNVFYDVNK